MLRTINRLRSLVPLEIIQKAGLTEPELIKKIQEIHPALVLLPWHLALQWTKVDAYYGAKRLRGPVVAGYLGEPLLPTALELPINRNRMTLIDLHRLSPEEAIPLILTLADDSQRGGLTPLFAQQLLQTPPPILWTLPWTAGQSTGALLDQVVAHPELQTSGWSSRTSQLRRFMVALWGLIHEEGPGAGELAQVQAAAARAEIAHFQMSISPSLLALRLTWDLPSWTARDVLECWWRRPDDCAPDTQALLQANSDFLRIQHHEDGARIELVAGFLPSMPSITAPREARTLIIEPLENRFAAENRGSAYNITPKAFPECASTNGPCTPPPSATGEAGDPSLVLALQRKLEEKERALQRMREGGVGENTQPVLRAPDLESLIGAVRDRLEDSALQIRDLHRAIREAGYRRLKPEEITKLRARLRSQQLRHKTWLTELSELIRKFERMNLDEFGEAA